MGVMKPAEKPPLSNPLQPEVYGWMSLRDAGAVIRTPLPVRDAKDEVQAFSCSDLRRVESTKNLRLNFSGSYGIDLGSMRGMPMKEFLRS